MKLRPAYIFTAAFLLLALLWGATRLYVVTRVPKLIVGPATTVFTGPILPDGTLDFEAALHTRYSVGVTPENNAFVLMRQAFDPNNLNPELRSRATLYLGSPEPLAGGDYYIDQLRYFGGKSYLININSQIEQASKRKWTRDEFPELASWIDANEQPLKVIEQASRRPKYYSPFLIGDHGRTNIRQHDVTNDFHKHQLREAVRRFVERALLRLAEGDVEATTNDLLTGHRLACLLRQDLTFVGQAIAVASEWQVIEAYQILLAGPLKESLIRRIQADINSFTCPPKVVETLDQGERLQQLATLLEIRRGHILINRDVDQVVPYMRYDVNEAMRQTNQFFDAAIKAQRIKNLRVRAEELEKLHQQVKAHARQSIASHRIVGGWFLDSGRSLSESTAKLIVFLLAPAVSQFQQTCDRARVRQDLLAVGLALAICRTRHGNYPKSLDALSPEFMPKVPLDKYANKPLQYRVKQDGFLLYSVGPNEVDDGGRPLGEKGDDIPFRVNHETSATP